MTIRGFTNSSPVRWDRSRARPAVGGGLPFLLFRLQGGFTVPPWRRFPKPPGARHIMPIFRNPSRFTIGGPLYGERVFLSNAEFIEKAATAWSASRPREMLSRSPFG